jgi:ABC-type multidrug transport system fused ATPase/permease subunit
VGTHTIRNSFERLDSLFAAPLEVDSPTAAPETELAGDIAFRDVTFSYGESQALRGFSATLEADTVLVLDGEGCLSQEGPPRELIRRDGFFRELFETQRLTE